MNWLWIVAIVAAAAMACVLIWLYSNRKKFFKRRSKEEKKARKEAKIAKKEAKNATVEPQPPQKKDDELIFTERETQVADDIQIQCEAYDSLGSSEDAGEYEIDFRRFDRRMPQMQNDFTQYDYDVDQKESLKDQLRALTPEMKAVVFGNLLDRKDDQF